MIIPLRRRDGSLAAWALIDDSDAELVLSRRWHLDSQGYPSCRGRGGKGGRLHELLLGRAPRGLVTDHRNGDKLDNRRENLRRVTQAVNCQNLAARSARGYRGVYLDRARGTWYVQVKSGGVKFCGGSGFASPDEAAVAAAALRDRLFPQDERGCSAALQRGD